MISSPLFIETMRICDGTIAGLERHIHRMQATSAEVFSAAVDLSQLLDAAIPVGAQKCRIVYGPDIKSIQFSDYTPRRISSLKLVEAPSSLDYHLKYADRSAIESLVALKGSCDDIIIVKDGLLTDTSFSNIVLTDGVRFVTPSTALLPGTMRSSLLEEGLITQLPLTPDDIGRYSHVALINAMLPLHRLPFIPIENIYH